MDVNKFNKDFTDYLNTITVEELIDELETNGVEFEDIPLDIPEYLLEMFSGDMELPINIPVFSVSDISAAEYNNNSNKHDYALAA